MSSVVELDMWSAKNPISWMTVAVVALVLGSFPAAQSQTAMKPELVLQTGHAGSINTIALSPDGRFLVSGSSDNSLKIWDVSTGSVLRTLFGHSRAVRSAAISSDGRLLASGADDGSVRVWDVATGEARVIGSHSTPVKDLAFSSDVKQLVSIDAYDLRVWDVAGGRQLRGAVLIDEKSRLTTMPYAVAVTLTSDGRFAAVAGGLTYRSGVLGIGGGIGANPIRVINTATGRDVDTFKLQGNLPLVSGVRFSPDGRMLAVKFQNAGNARRGTEGILTVYDVTTGKTLKAFASGDEMPTGGIEFSPDGRFLASRVSRIAGAATGDPAAVKGLIRLFDVGTWQVARELSGTGVDEHLDLLDDQPLSMTPLTFSRDGKLFAVSLGNSVTLFDTSSGSRIRDLRTTEKTAAISAAPTNMPTREQMLQQFGLDPDQLRSMMESTGALRSALSGGLRQSLERNGLQVVRPSAINFTPDGRQLSIVGSTTVWDIAVGAPRPVTATRQANPAMSLMASDGTTAYSPDGRFSARASVSFDAARAARAGSVGPSTIEVSEVATGRVIQTITLGTSTYTVPKELARLGQRSFESPIQVERLAYNDRGLVVQYCEGGGGVGLLAGGAIAQGCRIRTFDPMTGKMLRELKTDDPKKSSAELPAQQTLSSNGRLLVTVKLDRQKITAPNAGMRTMLGGLGRASGGGQRPTFAQPFTLTASDVDSGRKLWEVKGENNAPDGTEAAPRVTFSPGDAVMAVTSMDKSRQTILKLYTTASGREAGTIVMGDRTIANMTFSPDARLMAATFETSTDLRQTTGARSLPRGVNVITVYDVNTGRVRAELAHDSPVSDAAFSPNGRLIVSIAEDHNQYVWDPQTGEKLATMMSFEGANPFTRDQEWLVVTPDGLFDGSPGAWQQIMWRFSQNTFDVGPVESFFNELFYPGLASEIFAGRRPKAPRALQQIDRRQPRVMIVEPPTSEVTAREYTVRITVAEAPTDTSHREGSGVKDVRLFRNGTLVKVWPGDVLAGRPSTTLEATLPIVAGENRLSAYAFNRENVKSSDAQVVLRGGQSLARKGTAYVLALGVNEYENTQYNLKFARADATAFADEIRVQQERLGKLDRVEVVELLDTDATKANLLLALKRLSGAPLPANAPAALSKLAPAQPEDVVIIYFAGHGTAIGSRFYLVPHDLGYAGSRTGVDAKAIDTILAHSVSDLELDAAVEGLDAQQLVMVIDACNSGQALEAEEKRRGPMNSKGLAQLAYEKGMYILTAAQSYQAALETSQLGHGYLTFSLVEEGLKKGMADAGEKDGLVSVREWFDYATERVPQMQQSNDGSRLLLEADSHATDPNAVRNLQSPRAFYRREAESVPVIIGKP